jgi:hypothetical protein
MGNDDDDEYLNLGGTVTQTKIGGLLQEDTGLGVKKGGILSPPLKTVDLKKSHVVGTNYGE